MNATGATFGDVEIADSVFEDCVFDEADFRGVRMLRCEFKNCSFARANCDESSLTVQDLVDSNRYFNVDFRGASFRYCSFAISVFDGCRFDGKGLEGVYFSGATLVGGSFSGQLDSMIFFRFMLQEGEPPNLMDGVDFSASRWREVELRGIDASRIVPPNDPDILHVPNPEPVFRAFLPVAKAAGASGRRLSITLESELKHMLPKQKLALINRRDITGRLKGDDVARADALLQRLKMA